MAFIQICQSDGAECFTFSARNNRLVMSRNKISESIQQQVRSRADYLCEFCHANERWQYVKFTVDHMLPFNQSKHVNP
jgi:hypothetical protein